MSPFRPLLALLTAAALLLALPVAGADARRAPSRAAAKHKAVKKKRRGKQRKHGRQRQRPAAGDRIGTVSETDGDLVTVTLTRGGSVTARITEDTDGACAAGPAPDDDARDDDASLDDDPADGGSADESSDDSSDDTSDDDGEDLRSARLDAGCAATVGAAVYELVVDEGVYDVLRLTT